MLATHKSKCVTQIKKWTFSQGFALDLQPAREKLHSPLKMKPGFLSFVLSFILIFYSTHNTRRILHKFK